MHILIAWWSGFTWTALIQKLLDKNITVTLLTRSIKKVVQPLWSVQYLERDWLTTQQVSTVTHAINLSWHPIDDLPWTSRTKQRIYDSRIETTRKLISMLPSSTHTLLNASAIGYYPYDDTKIFDEHVIVDTDTRQWFLQHVVHKREQEATKFHGRLVLLRSWIILWPGKFEKAMDTQARLLWGIILGDWSQYLSTIKLEDRVRCVVWLIHDESFTGPINLVTQTLQQKTYITQKAATFKKKPWIRIPQWMITMLAWSASSFLLWSQRVKSVYTKKYLESK